MLEPSQNNVLPEIPSKRYFTIGEVSTLCDVKPHVLRYWEQDSPISAPLSAAAIAGITSAKTLSLFAKFVACYTSRATPLAVPDSALAKGPASNESSKQQELISDVIKELEAVLEMLKK